MTSRLTLATRRSALALAQSRAFARALAVKNPGLDVAELEIVTSGDKTQDRPLQDIGGKGLFVKELEEALLDRRADFAVHSIKDVPAELPPDFAAVEPRTPVSSGPVVSYKVLYVAARKPPVNSSGFGDAETVSAPSGPRP